MSTTKSEKKLEAPNILDAMQRARRGYKLMNKKAPGWQHSINPNILDMGNANACVIGQVFGDYEMVNTMTDIDEDDSWRYGFETRPEFNTLGMTDNLLRLNSQDYSMLQECWIFLITHDSSWAENSYRNYTELYQEIHDGDY